MMIDKFGVRVVPEVIDVGQDPPEVMDDGAEPPIRRKPGPKPMPESLRQARAGKPQDPEQLKRWLQVDRQQALAKKTEVRRTARPLADKICDYAKSKGVTDADAEMLREIVYYDLVENDADASKLFTSVVAEFLIQSRAK